MKLFSAICLIGTIVVMIMCILVLCNSRNFLSYEFGMIIGCIGFIVMLWCLLDD